MTGEIAGLLLVNGCLLAAGAGITRAFGMWRSGRELTTVLATSFLAGVAGFAVCAQLLYVLGFSLGIVQTLLVCSSLTATGFVRLPSARPLTASAPMRTWERFAVLLVAMPMLLLALDALYQPLASWDAWTQWTAKADALVELDGLDSSVFANPAYADWHPDYPLLVPALEAFAIRVGVGVRVIHLEFWLLLAAFVVALVELLRPRVGPLLTWCGVLAIVWTPKIGAETLSANADMPLAIFLVLTAVATWLWVTERNAAALGLVVVFGAATLATKLEGLIELSIVLAVAIALALRQSARLGLLLALAAGCAALVGLVPWRLWAVLSDAPVAYPAGSVVDSVIGVQPSRVPIAALLLLRQLLDPTVWLVLVPLALCAVAAAVLATRPGRGSLGFAGVTAVLVLVGLTTALVIPAYSFEWRSVYWLLFLPGAFAGAAFVGAAIRGGGSAAYVATSMGAMFAALVGVYLFTPYDFAWHLGTSTSRVVVPLGLFAAAFAPILLARGVEGGERKYIP